MKGSANKVKKKVGKALSNNSNGGSFQGRRLGKSTFHFRQERVSKQFMSAVSADDVNVVRNLIENGLCVDDVEGGIQALCVACQSGSLDMVGLLLNFGVDVNVMFESSLSPLHVTAKRGHDTILAFLLNRGANVNSCTPSEGRTPLHLAALSHRDGCARLLIACKANVNSKDIYGCTPLHLAVQRECESMTKLLLKSHADVNSYNNDGWTSLHCAAQTGNVQIAKILLDFNATIDCQNKYGRTPLHWACSSEHLPMVEFLLKKNANANVKDFHDKKALHYSKNGAIRGLVKPFTASDLSQSQSVTTSTIGLFVRIEPRLNGSDADADDDDGVFIDATSLAGSSITGTCPSDLDKEVWHHANNHQPSGSYSISSLNSSHSKGKVHFSQSTINDTPKRDSDPGNASYSSEEEAYHNSNNNSSSTLTIKSSSSGIVDDHNERIVTNSDNIKLDHSKSDFLLHKMATALDLLHDRMSEIACGVNSLEADLDQACENISSMSPDTVATTLKEIKKKLKALSHTVTETQRETTYTVQDTTS